MFSAIHIFIEKVASRLGYETEFLDKNTESKYNKTIQEMRHGTLPAKTVNNIPKAFNLALKKENHTDWLFYVYDPAGESYTKIDYVSLQKYNEYASGMIFLIDPFSFSAVRNKYSSNDIEKEVSPGKLSVNDTLSRLLSALEESFGYLKLLNTKNHLL